MSNSALAFFTGLIGSFHCAAMCGPLVMALPVKGKRWYIELFHRILYQAGRITTYALLGFAAGLIGGGFKLLGLQQFLSLITGVLFLIAALQYFTKFKSSQLSRFQAKIFNPAAALLGRWLNNPFGSFFAGSLHGFLPCGMLYIAILSSVNTGSPLNGSEFMLYFGLGTSPLLLMASFSAVFIKRIKFKQYLIPAMYLVAGMFMIIRAANLDIAYVSAAVPKAGEAAICK